MIASLRGVVLSQDGERVVLEAAGVGYEVLVTQATARALPAPGHEAFLLTVESFGMYGGGATLYGFATPAEKSLFSTIKDEVPGTGAKKALEYLDKASKSLPDFRRAILDQDAKMLTGVFGFSKKTAERLVDALKDKLESVQMPGAERLKTPASEAAGTSAMSQALNALSSLGYKPAEARAALLALAEEKGAQDLPAEQIVRLALKRL
ncbi:MAG: Holliday junction branch migration protein RuvA [Elusimicrobiota bacterium]